MSDVWKLDRTIGKTMMESTYNGKENLAQDLQTKLSRSGIDADVISKDGDSRVSLRVGSSLIKMEKMGDSKVKIDQNSMDWKMLDEEAKNIIMGQMQNAPKGDSDGFKRLGE